MLDLIASFLVRGLNAFFHVMPIQFNLWCGRRLGGVARLLSGKRQRIAYANLKAAFCAEKTPNELKRIANNVYRHLGQTFVEILSMTKVDKRYIQKFVKVRDLERIEKASKNPNGMILISAHFGNWELSTVTSVAKGFPLYLLARDQKMERLNELLNILRESKGNLVIRKGADIKNLFRVLRDGKSIGILADQNAGASGQLVDFFGRPASVAVGPYRIAQKTGAWLLPAFIHRTKGPYHDLILEPLMIIEKGDDVIPYMREYNRLLEKHIRDYPEQWMWMHKRWKMTPLKKVMVLDDGKKGHLKQSLAVVEQVKRYREKEGCAPEETEIEVVRIRFRSKIAKFLFNVMRPFFGPGCQGRLGLLRMALDRESYANAVGRYADVIISCGSALCGVNIILKMENYAHNLAVLDPGFLCRGKFDLIVSPRHDLRGRRVEEKMIVTHLAPNTIKPSNNNAGGKNKPCIGLLFGGDNRHFAFDEALTRSVAEEVEKTCDAIDASFYATTSRRTPQAPEEILKTAFTGNPRCVKFISGKNDKDEHTVEKILSSSDVVIVSGESISMVSEAVASGKPVLVFMPKKITSRRTKYERFVDGLDKSGYLSRVEPGEISSCASRAVRQKTRTVSLPDDNRRIFEKMYKLF